MNKKLIVWIGVIGLSVILGLLSHNTDSIYAIQETTKIKDNAQALITQEVVSKFDEPIEVTKIYHQNQLLGIIQNKKNFDDKLQNVYETEYKQDFKESRLDFDEDIFLVSELSYNRYENKDDAIFEYIHDNKLFSIETHKVSFSNGAVIYVKNIEDFEKAQDVFIRNFVSSDESYNKLKNNDPIQPLWDYGVQDVSLSVKESLTYEKGFAKPDDILVDESQILLFLSYGYDPQIETYEVQRFDTIDGIAWNHGLIGAQLVAINRDQVQSREQLLEPGINLNISKFDSPFTVTVTKERKTHEILYPEEPRYIEDDTLKEGTQVVDVVAENGSRDVTYLDTYINMESADSREVSSKIMKEPIRSEVRIGTKVEPRIGSGNFRIPVSNPLITCVYGNSCYRGHNGTDFVYVGNGGYGPIYASDRGVVVSSGYASDWGYNTLIDHGNGYMTRYAHMMTAPYVNAGDVVASGENIGYIGSSGRVTGPHLHFEVYQNGVRIDPCSVLGC